MLSPLIFKCKIQIWNKNIKFYYPGSTIGVFKEHIFIVFSTNKVAGIFLLPFVVILSFSYGLLHDIAITLSITLVVILFVYRYFLSYAALQRQLRISLFHFALYFCAFELAPVLLINKLLFRFLI